ncbi:MAG TPA: hypothetical protein DDW65_21430 [Firmicutes bacterium]|jgi:L-arabinose transport system substrate-binding protein|nr:hypothetical protein [Bacillota bacterium]
MKRILRVLTVILIGMLVLGGTMIDAKKEIKIGYISKMLTHPWFIQESMGLEKKCKEMGVKYVAIDANLKDEQCLAAVDNLVAQNIDALAICATNQGMGPVIAKKCKEAGIALCTIDDNMKDDTGNPIPHVGMPTKEVGVLGGKALGKMAMARGFFKAGNVVKVLQIAVPTVSVFQPRYEGYKEGLQAVCPKLKDSDFVVQGSKDGMFDDDLQVASSIINANPKVTHWIITGGNDDCALAPLKILQENKFNMNNVLACGLGGYELSLAEFKKKNSSYICIVLQPDVEGEKAAQMLYNNVTAKKAMPLMTLVSGSIATVDNYLQFFPGGKLKVEAKK